MDRQTLNFVLVMLLVITVGALGHIIGAAISRKQFSMRSLLVLMALVAATTALMVARG